jgi:hypothetical protein
MSILKLAYNMATDSVLVKGSLPEGMELSMVVNLSPRSFPRFFISRTHRAISSSVAGICAVAISLFV